MRDIVKRTVAVAALLGLGFGCGWASHRPSSDDRTTLSIVDQGSVVSDIGVVNPERTADPGDVILRTDIEDGRGRHVRTQFYVIKTRKP